MMGQIIAHYRITAKLVLGEWARCIARHTKLGGEVGHQRCCLRRLLLMQIA